MGILDRLALVRGYLSSSRDFPMTSDDLLFGLLKQPCGAIAPRYVLDTRGAGEHLVVRLRGIETPLYWPRCLPLFDLHKVVTEACYERDWHFYEVPETAVRAGDSVLDCGAAEGLFSLRVLDRAGTVTAFEPLPLFARSMRRTFAESPTVTVRQEALGAAPGRGRLRGDSLYGQLDDGGDDGHGVEVAISSIDRWAADSGRRVDYIKADVESREIDVLRGAVHAIAEYRPRVAITVYHPGNVWTDMLGLLRSVAPGYRYRVKGLSYGGSRSRPVMLHAWHP